MIKMGVPKEAVRHKMALDTEVDPAALDMDPSKPLPREVALKDDSMFGGEGKSDVFVSVTPRGGDEFGAGDDPFTLVRAEGAASYMHTLINRL